MPEGHCSLHISGVGDGAEWTAEKPPYATLDNVAEHLESFGLYRVKDSAFINMKLMFHVEKREPAEDGKIWHLVPSFQSCHESAFYRIEKEAKIVTNACILLNNIKTKT